MQNEEEGSELSVKDQLFKTVKDLYADRDNLYSQAKIEMQAAGSDIENFVDSVGRTVQGEEFTKVQSAIFNYTKNLIEFEGNHNNAGSIHIPGADEKAKSGSGITIANGLDATGTSRKQMEEYGVPERILKQMDGLQAWKLGTKATIPKDLKLEQMNEEEFEKVTFNIATSQTKEAEQLSEDYPDLTPKGLAILLNLKHWGGSLKSTTESKLTRHLDNLNGEKSETGELVSPIHDALNNPNVTDQDLIEAMDSIRTSYIPWGKGKGSMRYQTVSKYIANLD